MKITGAKPHPNVVTMTTTSKKKIDQAFQWWKSRSKKELCNTLVATAAYLKENQAYRYRQAAIYARLYGNLSLFNFAGSNMTKMDQTSGAMPDKPTFNVIQSSVDTLVSRISQQRPAPVFLTDNGNYKERNLAKKLNNFILGEFYQTKAYEKATMVLRDALVEGTGCLKIYELNGKVAIERVLLTELLVDMNESAFGDPRQLYQIKLIDREVLKEQCPGYGTTIDEAEKAYPDNSTETSRTVSDLVMVVEGWRLPSGPDAHDGRHTIACSSGVLLDEKYEKPTFPFVFLHYSHRMLGFWSQGLAEQLMGTQLEINSLLYTISKAIKLVGVPRVFQDEGSKVSNVSHNNDIGVIVKYRGTMPEYRVVPCNAPELYAERDKLIQYAYQQCGVSSLQATSQKPAGLNSGEAIRSYDDISTDRFASLSRKYDNFFVDLAYQIIDLAKDICEETGKYETIYPGKDGTKTIDLPKASLLNDPFVIQCFNMSSLPKDPAGRMQKVVEMMQSGMITLKEGRRLLDFPDLGQIEKLANASEERIFQILDEIVEDGTYTPPDPFMDLQLAVELTTQYYNLYVAAKLEPEKAEMLRNFHTSALEMITKASQPPMPAPGMPQPQAVAAPPPVSDMLPNAPGIAA
jgi:hypothetical protein